MILINKDIVKLEKNLNGLRVLHYKCERKILNQSSKDGSLTISYAQMVD